ncbi:MAG: excinuclease ABC subunit UvrC, partial [Actinobacteria bacterium]|nr:excinuclease ABC subunit UvrC [Actinomycetota bacterium]
MSNDLSFRPKTSEIPTRPGVYRFYDSKRRILYVGKAKNLRARLQSYFAPLDSLHERTRRMVQTAVDVEWTIVKTEFEALQLEFTWIKEFNPPFNIRFKDDKSYPYLAVSMSDKVPRVFVTRNRELKGVKYFGPYTQAWALRQTLDTLLKAFPVRSCSSGVFATAKRSNRPCLLADIGKCSAPCVSRVTDQEHVDIAKELVNFMSGMDPQQVEILREKMLLASKNENFELAARLRDNIEALETVLEKSTVVFSDLTDADIFGIAHDELAATISLFSVRGGRIRGVRAWTMDKELDQSLDDLVRQIIVFAYSPVVGVEAHSIPKEVLVPSLPEDSSDLELFLAALRGSAVSLRVPKRGDKAALAQTALENAEHALALYKTRRVSDFAARTEALNRLASALDLTDAPLRIECYDISHLSGTDIVGSMVVFEDGLPKKAHYRQFNIESAQDDTDAIFQVLTRRLKYLRDPETVDEGRFSYVPSLIVVDGGIGQVNAAARAIEASGVTGLAVCGLAKRLEEVWLPGNENPIILPRASEELFLLQRLRDESHRFALTASRRKRTSAISSSLLEIPGLGEKRVMALLKRFGSAKRLRIATLDEISDVAGIGRELASQILERLK